MNRRTLLAGIVAAPLAPSTSTGARAELILVLSADLRRFEREMARAASDPRAAADRIMRRFAAPRFPNGDTP